jgi:hypothetical protein
MYTSHPLSHPLHLPIRRRPNRPPHDLNRIRRQQRNSSDNRALPPKLHTRHKREIKIPLHLRPTPSQERYTAEVNPPRAEDASDHEPVPRRDLHSHHDEFVEHEHREGHADHAREGECAVAVDADEELAEALDHAALVDADGDPDEEALVAEATPRFELGVEFWVEVCDRFVHVAVQHERENGHHRVDSAVPDEQPVLVQRVGLVGRGDAVDGLADGDDEAAVDDELAQLRAPFVAVAAVPHEQFDEVAELLDAEVGGERGLAAFFANDADAHVRGLDHAHVVAAVADAADAFFRVGADEAGDVGFLRGGAAAGDDGGELHGQGDEVCAEVG